jgi:hypothetical protein
MPERSSLAATIQIAKETTPGTAVPANKQLQSIGIAPGIQIDVNEFRPIGTKYRTQVNPGREWTQADLSGQPVYDELAYVLASILGASVDTVTGTTGQLHTYNPSSTAEDTPITLSVEQGSAVRAHKFAYGLVTDLNIDFSRENVELGGTMIGQRITDGATMTASPTALPQSPILPGQMDVFIDPTSGALGTTKLTRVLSGSFSLGSRFGPIWPVNSALTSFAAHVETEPDAGLSLVVEADAAGMAMLTNLRAGSTQFARLLWTGPVIGAGPAVYKLQIDCAVKVGGANPWDDVDGLYCIEWPFTIIHDGTWGKALVVALTNATAAL